MNSDKRELKYVEYIKTASQQQSDGNDGGAMQRSALRRLAKAQGLQVVAHIEDIGASSHIAGTRPGYNRLIELVTSGKANAILCMSFEKLSRNTVEWTELSHMLRRGILAEIRFLDGVYRTVDPIETIMTLRQIP